MAHLPYFPDLAPCDYWLNDYMKRNLIDEANEKCLGRALSKVVKSMPEEEPFDKPLEEIELCISNHGGYFEHLIKYNSNFLILFIFFFSNCRTFGRT